MDSSAIGISVGPVEQGWTPTDCILYALGVGCAADDPLEDLAFTTEHTTGTPQRVLPTYPVVVAARLREIYRRIPGLDMSTVVHGDQSIELHRPLTPDATVMLTTRVADVFDKGKGALLRLESQGRDPQTGELVFTSRAGLFVRGAGGWGGDRGPAAPAWSPTGDPVRTIRYVTAPDQALLYRLSGDRNPLHSDPAVASRAGFERPILHGLCTFGYAGRALLAGVCDADPARFLRLSGRFSRPVTPGQALVTRIWTDVEGHALFDVTLDDGTEVLSQGVFDYLTG